MELGLNDNFNGQLRSYIPKGNDLRKVADENMRQEDERLNLVPKKYLGFRYPDIVIREHI